MSEANKNTEQDQALSVLRNVWQGKHQNATDIAEACGTTKPCKSIESLGFSGLTEEFNPATKKAGATPVDDDLRYAWKMKLKAEGKLREAGSVRDLVFGQNRPE